MRSYWSIFLVLLLCSPGSSRADLVFGPYLQDVRRDRITVVVETTGGDSCAVHWGDGLANVSQLGANGVHHEGVIDGLSASTCYPYQVVCGAQTSPEGSFCSAALAHEPFSFVVYGDTRSNHADHQAVVQAIATEGVDFYLNTGDLVSNGENDDDWPPFFQAEGDLMRSLPLYPAIGNHDEDDGQLNNYLRLFAPPSDSSGDERYYAFSYGNSRFIVLDDKSQTLLGPNLTAADPQGAWFMDELTAAADDPTLEHLFIFLHENMYSVKDGRSGDGNFRAWRTIMLEKGVDFVFSGHDHYYCRGEADNGLGFAVAGGGGAGLYDVKDAYQTEGTPVSALVWDLMCPLTCPFTVHYAKAIHHYIRVDINGSRFSACTKDIQGAAFDCWSYGQALEDGGVSDGDGGLPDADGGILDGSDGDSDGVSDGAADDDSPDPCSCPGAEPDPVCGEDGVTYEHMCAMDCAQVGLDHRGECVGTDGGSGGDDDPCNCVGQAIEPVCGVDGQTYANPCRLACAAIPLAYQGECRPPDGGACSCPDEDQQVCGSDGRTYRNECTMNCMGVSLEHTGPCSSSGGCSCQTSASDSDGGFLLFLGLLCLAWSRRSRSDGTRLELPR